MCGVNACFAAVAFMYSSSFFFCLNRCFNLRKKSNMQWLTDRSNVSCFFFSMGEFQSKQKNSFKEKKATSYKARHLDFIEGCVISQCFSVIFSTQVAFDRVYLVNRQIKWIICNQNWLFLNESRPKILPAAKNNNIETRVNSRVLFQMFNYDHEWWNWFLPYLILLTL